MPPKPLKCSKCDFKDSCNGLVQKHKENQHKERYKCETCDYTASNKSNLKHHIENTNPVKKWWQYYKAGLAVFIRERKTTSRHFIREKITPLCDHCHKSYHFHEKDESWIKNPKSVKNQFVVSNALILNHINIAK